MHLHLEIQCYMKTIYSMPNTINRRLSELNVKPKEQKFEIQTNLKLIKPASQEKKEVI